MSPLPRLHHHDVMTVVGSFMYVPWCVKDSAVHYCRQQCLVAKWLEPSVAVRVRARAREWKDDVM